MTLFFERRRYPRSVITTSRKRTQRFSRERALIRNTERHDRTVRSEKVPLVLTHHPKNQEVKKILLMNFRILTDDPSTKDIFSSKPLSVYRRNTSLRDILVNNTFSTPADPAQTEPAGTFPCHRPRCRTCDFTGRTETVTSTNGMFA